MASKRDRQIARAEAKVRFGSERATLSDLVSQAEKNYADDLTAAGAASRSAAHFARAAKPGIRDIYHDAAAQTQTANADVDRALAGLGAAADPYRAIVARERGGATGRLATANAQALKSLTDREQEAVAGKLYAEQNAKTQYRDTLNTLATKLQDLGDREGAFAVARIGTLGEARAKRKAQTRNTRLAAGLRSDAADVAYQRELDKIRLRAELRDKGATTKGLSGNKPASRTEVRGFQGNVAKALAHAKRYIASGDPRSKAASALTTGVS